MQADERARQLGVELGGKLRGRGLASFLEVTAPQNKEMSGLRFEADGTVTFYIQALRSMVRTFAGAGFTAFPAERLRAEFKRMRPILEKAAKERA